LVDDTLVPVHRLDHPFEDRVEELARLLRVAVGQQLHRALKVGEEDRDLLALALEGGLRGEDLLDEVLRGVGLGGDRRGGQERRSALAAELVPGWVRRTTGRTR
jgi:hypothetical protein